MHSTMEIAAFLEREITYSPESQSVPSSPRCFSTELLRPRPMENSESERGIAAAFLDFCCCCCCCCCNHPDDGYSEWSRKNFSLHNIAVDADIVNHRKTPWYCDSDCNICVHKFANFCVFDELMKVLSNLIAERYPSRIIN